MKVDSEECYQAAKKPRGPARIPMADRFRTKVSRAGPVPVWHPEFGNCHIWTASLGTNGYGQINVGGAPIGAHIVAWELASGARVPDGVMVGHTCDHRVCVRNDEAGTYSVQRKVLPRFGHLWLGTIADNNADMYAKGRAGAQTTPEKFARGERIALAKLTDITACEIRRAYASGEGTTRSLAVRFGVHASAIQRVVNRETWRHI